MKIRTKIGRFITGLSEIQQLILAVLMPLAIVLFFVLIAAVFKCLLQ